MTDTFEGIHFGKTLPEFKKSFDRGYVIHCLCTEGSMTFSLMGKRFELNEGDYAIFPNFDEVSDFSDSSSFKGFCMALSDSFILSIALRSNYTIVGHMSLLQNPILKLSPREFNVCRQALVTLKDRLTDENHFYREELLGSLLTAHILDLFDIHVRARQDIFSKQADRPALLLKGFIKLLKAGYYKENRHPKFYSEKLYITPHYLSELCNKFSGKPASYWIDRFTIQEIIQLLRQKELSLTEISDRLNFSSVSYFSRYVQKQLKMTPSEYRKKYN